MLNGTVITGEDEYHVVWTMILALDANALISISRRRRTTRGTSLTFLLCT